MAAKSKVVVQLRPTRHAPKRRKKSDEWRAINRSHRVKDRRVLLLLAIPDPRRPGSFIISEAYWHRGACSWWWANTAPNLPECDAIADVYDITGGMWMPMVQPPMAEAA